MQGEAKPRQAIEPIPASFVRPCALIPEKAFPRHLVISRPSALELIIILIHVSGETIPSRQAPIPQPARRLYRPRRQRNQRRTCWRLKWACVIGTRARSRRRGPILRGDTSGHNRADGGDEGAQSPQNTPMPRHGLRVGSRVAIFQGSSFDAHACVSLTGQFK